MRKQSEGLPSKQYSQESITCSSCSPGTILTSSADCDWRSLLVQTIRYPANMDSYETRPTPDQLIVVGLRGTGTIESFSGRSWKQAQFVAGRAGMTASKCTSRLRWSSNSTAPVEVARIYLPNSLFEELEDEYRSYKTPFRRTHRDTLSFEDPSIANIARALVAALQAGSPDLYAASAAVYMATHLLSVSSSWATGIDRGRSPGTLPKSRMERVLEFMRNKFREPVTLEDLATEAGISRFHLVSCFRERTGMSPHQYLIQLRLTEAAKLLCDTDASIQAIAQETGYASAAHFSTAFRKHFRVSAQEYRRACGTNH